MLIIFSKCFSWERSCQSHTAGSGGTEAPSVAPGQNPSGGPGGEGPGSTEILAFYNIKNRLKNHLCCAFFCVLLCII